MITRIWQALRDRPVRALAVSLVLHAAVIALLLVGVVPSTTYTVKRGEPLFVELPELPEPAPAGDPAARSLGAVRRERPAPVKPAPPLPPTPPAMSSPPKPEAPVEENRPVPSPPVVASRPAAPEPPRAPEPPSATEPEAPAPVKPEEPVTQPAPTPIAEPSPPAADRPASVVERPSGQPEPAPEPAGPPHVAAVPPAPETPAPVDIRSALRGGGAGSARGGGRGGIEGEPIPLDSTEARFNDYLERLRRKIKSNWGFPCIKDERTRECEHKTTFLVVEFGILKDGRLQFVDVLQSSGYPIYDDYAVNAVKFSSPFPAVPSSLIMAMKQGSSGVAIKARFNYIVDTSLTNILR